MHSFTRRLFMTCLYAAVGLTLSHTSLAKVIVSEIILPVPQVEQENAKWCWLAVTEMAIRYRVGKSPTQCEMYEALEGWQPGACCGKKDSCDRAGYTYEMDRIMAIYAGVFAKDTKKLDEVEIYNYLKQGMPVVANVLGTMPYTHVIVIRGMRYKPVVTRVDWRGVPIIEYVPMLYVNNPARALPEWKTYEAIRRNWIDTVVIGYSPLPPPPVPVRSDKLPIPK